MKAESGRAQKQDPRVAKQQNKCLWPEVDRQSHVALCGFIAVGFPLHFKGTAIETIWQPAGGVLENVAGAVDPAAHRKTHYYPDFFATTADSLPCTAPTTAPLG